MPKDINQNIPNNKTESLRVSVVLPAYNEELVIEQTLQSILDQDYDDTFEIIVCDNNSKDKTVEIAKRMGAKVILETRKGSRFAYDTAMRNAKGDLILVTNADVKLPKNWITSIVKAYDNPEIIAVGTSTRFYGCPEWVNLAFGTLSTFSPKRAMWGVSMSCRRDAFYKVGGLNHGVNINEDAIFTLLLEKIGKIAYVDDVIVEMDGRRFNNGFLNAIKEWMKGYGFNSLSIQFNYIFLGKIKALMSNFSDHRSQVFGKGEDYQICTIVNVQNDAETLVSFINSYKSQRFDRKNCVVALMDGTKDESENILKLYPFIKVFNRKKPTWAEDILEILFANNAAVYSFVSGDVKLEEEWLEKIYENFEKDEDVDLVGGSYVRAMENFMSRSIKSPFELFKINSHNFAAKKELLVQALSPEVSNAKELLTELKRFANKDKFVNSLSVISFKETEGLALKERFKDLIGVE